MQSFVDRRNLHPYVIAENIIPKPSAAATGSAFLESLFHQILVAVTLKFTLKYFCDSCDKLLLATVTATSESRLKMMWVGWVRHLLLAAK